jgi:molybdopterin molybdotransferase
VKSIDQALELLASIAWRGSSETIPIHKSVGRVVSEAIHAKEASPLFDNSAMDGFGVVWEDTKEAKDSLPLKFRLAGESRAGHPFHGELRQGEVIRINTGAVVPPGIDTVIPIEDVEVINDGEIEITEPPKKGQHVRYEGEEFKAGTQLLGEGTVLTPAISALLAGNGIFSVPVFALPKVSLLTTGDEIIRMNREPVTSTAAQLAPGQIRESNSIFLEAAVNECNGDITRSEQVRDDAETMRKSLDMALSDSDIVIITGGVSVGPHDHVKSAALDVGCEQLLWRVKQKPGKPLFVAKRGSTLLFGLPGNPRSAMTCFYHYVQPVIRYFGGRSFERQRYWGSLSKSVDNKGTRPVFKYVNWRLESDGSTSLCPLDKQGSHMIMSMREANGYFILPEQTNWNENQSIEFFSLY